MENGTSDHGGDTREIKISIKRSGSQHIVTSNIQQNQHSTRSTIPVSSDDLLLNNRRLLMHAVSIYEVLRHFGSIIRLSPFRFEDFCCALLIDEQSNLLSEIHLQLLRACLREDKQQQTWYGPPDLRDSINLYLHLADSVTWPAALRVYLSADPNQTNDTLQLLLDNPSYPFEVDIETRLIILQYLCDQFMLTTPVRDDVCSDNGAKHDDHCRSCHKNGQLVHCTSCTASYHAKCTTPPLTIPPEPIDGDETEEETPPWECTVCIKQQVRGVTDCIDPIEKDGCLRRHEPIGCDRLGRRYWLLCRRIFVVNDDETDVRYYSTCEQLTQLIASLDDNHGEDEANLRERLLEMENEIKRQMQITEEMINEYSNVYQERDLILTQNVDGSVTRASRKESPIDEIFSFKLGLEANYRSYKNLYTSHQLALNKYQHSENEKNRALANKFCLNSTFEFRWHGTSIGTLPVIVATLRTTIIKLESSLPHVFMHPAWPLQRANWIKGVNVCSKAQDFALALSILESCIKPVLFKPAWFECLGFTNRLHRTTLAEREELKKTDRAPRGFERREYLSEDFELSARLGTAVKFPVGSRKIRPTKHQIWKQKGEEYRLTGLNGWYWRSATQGSRLPAPKPRPELVIPFPPEQNDDSIKTSENGTDNCNGSGTANNAVNTNNSINNNGNIKSNNNAKKLTNKQYRSRLPPCHDFTTQQTKIRSLFVIPKLDLKRLARSGGQREARGFSSLAKPNSHIWPYGITPRPVLRTCWLYRNRILTSIHDICLQLRVFWSCLRWDDLQVRPPVSGNNVIMTDTETITVELLKRHDLPPYMLRSEYLIRKTVVPIEQPTKYTARTSSTQSIRSGLRARKRPEAEEDTGPTTVEIRVPEEDLELWEIKQFGEKLERAAQIAKEKAAREETERRRRADEELARKRRTAAAAAAVKKVNTGTGTPTVVPMTVIPSRTFGANSTPILHRTPIIVNRQRFSTPILNNSNSVSGSNPATPTLGAANHSIGLIALPRNPIVINRPAPTTTSTSTPVDANSTSTTPTSGQATPVTTGAIVTTNQDGTPQATSVSTPNSTTSTTTTTYATQVTTEPSEDGYATFKTDIGHIIRLPQTYLQRGTIIVRHVGQQGSTNYIIRPMAPNPSPAVPSATAETSSDTTGH